tara:strand:+ start:7081 stop:7524 length:444 start_codon:yes stop_codon:yes gene_type:complete
MAMGIYKPRSYYPIPCIYDFIDRLIKSLPYKTYVVAFNDNTAIPKDTMFSGLIGNNNFGLNFYLFRQLSPLQYLLSFIEHIGLTADKDLYLQLMHYLFFIRKYYLYYDQVINIPPIRTKVKLNLDEFAELTNGAFRSISTIVARKIP